MPRLARLESLHHPGPRKLAALSILCLLTGCGPQPGAAPASLAQVSAAALEGAPPTQQSDILPGSKGERPGILPGSKGDRNHLASLEVELHLPLAEGFSLAQLSAQDTTAWQAELDGQKAVRLRLLQTRQLTGEQALTFVLEDLAPLKGASLHELVFYSESGTLQSAGLIPALSEPRTRLAEPLSSETLASWMIAREIQQNAPLQQFDPARLKALRSAPETADLSQELKTLYRQSKGKADPRKAVKVLAKARDAAQKLTDKPIKDKGI